MECSGMMRNTSWDLHILTDATDTKSGCAGPTGSATLAAALSLSEAGAHVSVARRAGAVLELDNLEDAEDWGGER